MQTQNTERKYRADIAYIGTAYKGFQFQANGDSIQSQLEKAFSTILRHPVRIRGASRTDSGVHAEHQVISFCTNAIYEGSDWRYSLNCVLPKDIAIQKIAPVDPKFDPINDSIGKIYRYRLWKGQCTFPHLRPFVWGLPKDFDAESIKSEILHFLGQHDFSSFCSIDSDATNKVREIYEVKVDIRDPLIDIWVVGRGFLKQMIRIMVGTLVDIALGKIPKASIPRIIEMKKRECAGQTAPPQGLTLVKILYDERPDLESVIEEASRGYCLKV